MDYPRCRVQFFIDPKTLEADHVQIGYEGDPDTSDIKRSISVNPRLTADDVTNIMAAVQKTIKEMGEQRAQWMPE